MSVALLGVPYDDSSSYRRGPAKAPAAIRAEWDRAVQYSNLTTESGIDLSAPNLLRDAGDVRCGPAAETRASIEESVGQLLDAGERPLLLGGDHSLTYPALRAAHARYGQLDVLHFDAHPDLYPQLDGDKFSHACAFTRSLEGGLIDRLVQVGIRTANRPQREVAEQHGVEQLTMANWKSGSAFFFERPVWISLDLDALDPAFAPGVSHPEPGGLSVRDIIGVLQRLGGNVIGADLVEYNPDTDIQGVTAPVCFKLIKELAAVLLQ